MSKRYRGGVHSDRANGEDKDVRVKEPTEGVPIESHGRTRHNVSSVLIGPVSRYMIKGPTG